MLGSNFTYKDKKVSIVLTSVFNYLLNLPFGKYGAGDEARLGFAPRSENSAFKPKGLVASFLRYPDYLTSFVSSVRKSAELGTGFQPVTTSLHYLL